ncbi:hypothetical protein Nmel_001625 [Mimus melanotis]
MGFLINE